MNCPTCQHFIPDNLLACPGCMEDRSRAAVAAAQLGPLRAVKDGTADLIVRTVSRGQHIQLFSFDHTFCGLHVAPQAPRRRMAYSQEAEVKKLCNTCRWHVEKLMEESCRNSA